MDAPRDAKAARILAGRKSRREGGRWNPRGLCAAVYASLEPETALCELLATLCDGRPVRTGDTARELAGAAPCVLVGMECRLRKTLDLTDPAVRRALGVSARSLAASRWEHQQNKGREARPQALGRAAFEAGAEALVVPSARRRGGRNLVVFPENLGRGSALRVRALRG
jgi:RES domain-containing protein